MGYYLVKNNYQKQFLYHNIVAIAFRMIRLLITGNKLAWKKISGLLKKSVSYCVVNNDIAFIDEEVGDLLSICVLDNYKGCGVAHRLVESYTEVLRRRNRKYCLLTVAMDNGRGIKFYEKNGFVVWKEAVGVGRAYIKRI